MLGNRVFYLIAYSYYEKKFPKGHLQVKQLKSKNFKTK